MTVQSAVLCCLWPVCAPFSALHSKPFLPLEPVQLLVVHVYPFALQHQTGPAIAKAAMTGDYVSFVMLGDGYFFSFEEDTEISLGAPKDGPMAGLLFFEAPDPEILGAKSTASGFFATFADLSALSKMRRHRIKSNNTRKLLGTLYLPNSVLQTDANAPVADESAYTAIVARQVWLLEGPHLVLNSDYAATDVPVPSSLAGGDVRLTQ